jgi:CRISPR/Cas system Type II protein with McrA/HNH and RuvC-like nuclease domain
MNKNLGPKILELRNSGLTYNEIVVILKCSKATVCYHCADGQKDKTRNRTRKMRKSNPLIKKINNFTARKNKNSKSVKNIKNEIIKILSKKIEQFKRNTRKTGIKSMFSYTEFINKIGNNPKCYLTGRDIDLSNSRSYHLDHIIPISKGGDNSLENCGLACRNANLAKSDMSLNEFYQLCEDVIKNKITKF